MDNDGREGIPILQWPTLCPVLLRGAEGEEEGIEQSDHLRTLRWERKDWHYIILQP